MAKLEHVIPQGDDNELGILRPVLDVIGYNGNIPEVERSVNLVHEIQWRRLENVQCKHQCEGT